MFSQINYYYEVYYINLQQLQTKLSVRMIQDLLNQEQNILIVVYGLPASGKTSFGRNLKKHFFSSFIFISADILEMKSKQKPQILQSFYKLNQSQIINQLRKMQIQASIDITKPKFDHQNWNKSRKLADYLIQNIIKKTSIIFQDDLLLRSQRKVLKKIAWTNKIKYLQILMDSTLQECLQNLENRFQVSKDSVVTEEVIKKAAEKLQIEETYGIKIKLNERNNIHKTQILNHLKFVEIHPNDPNNKQFFVEKQKHILNETEIKEIKVRNYIHLLMGLTQNQIYQKLRLKQAKANQLNDKKKLGILLSNWKKVFLKQTKLQKVKDQQIQQHLICYVDKILYK